MATLTVSLPANTTICNGKQITFKTPSSGDNITGIIINAVTYSLVDSSGNGIASRLTFAKDAIVSVILDVTNKKAYLQNGVSVNKGSATQPVYIKDGVATATTYTLGKSVPSNAVFTDTHFTTGLKVGASAAATANAAATNGSVYLNVLDNTTVRDSHLIKGSGATTVTSDANGVITITSTDTNTNTTYSAGVGINLSGTTFSNSGVRNVAAGSTANQIKVNTGGTESTITVNNVANATSAASATKATQDSAGQQINTTYIKGLSVSGKVITYTKGDGTTGTITTQDTNTTYSTGTASASGLTKLYTGTGTNTDGTMTQSAIKSALDAKAPLASPALTGTPTTPTASNSVNNTQIANTAFVHSVVNEKIAAADAMIFKGTIGTGGTVTALPNTHKTGWAYKVITAGTFAGQKCEIGDLIVCLTDGTSATDSHWTVVQTNIDGAVTGPASSVDARVAVFNGTTGRVIKDSGYTIGKSVPSNAVFTDTHYTTGLKVGATASANANAAASNGSVYINILDNTTIRDSHLIKGAGATTVTSDANGVITISSTDTNTNTTYSAGAGISLSGTIFSNSGVRSIAAGSSANQIKVNTGGTESTITVNNVANATAATKATQDSAGQQINTTYIKGLSVSGKVITYTKGDGTTGTITTQDTNTDTKVTQSAVTDADYTNYRSLVWGSSNSSTKGFTPSTVTDSLFTCKGLYVQPSSGLIHATTFEGALSGNASTATKATQDSAGQQINTTYIKGLSVSGKTITYTKGDGTTGTITTQDTNTTYSASNGISLSGTTFSNSGVRSIATGSANGTISVNTNGTTANVAVKGLGSAAYTASSAYATASHTQAASTITGLATVATSGSYNDLSNKPTIPAAYSLPDATSSVKGGVKVGSNITVSSGTISLTKANVTGALGYTPVAVTSGTTDLEDKVSTLANGTLYLVYEE